MIRLFLSLFLLFSASAFACDVYELQRSVGGEWEHNSVYLPLIQFKNAEFGDELVAVDWGSLGYGPVGADLGYYLLMAREEFEPLLDAYLLGLPDGIATREEVMLGAQVTAVYTVFTRADWALARVAGGEGALAGKYRHPSVAPHLRALQRQFPHIEALVGG